MEDKVSVSKLSKQQTERLTHLGGGLSLHLLYNWFVKTNHKNQDQ